ncbi:MAG: T9SS type A sorting domain-containing protein [Melioribacteraceae bacterium]|nr:T9SS type A sorting domain-containing protein [Melioribacteraceae bacterium]MCF8354778.1 T9SS type A sorting domain-containing protein [Melioribacteraceae bacterium]MCF8393328.1 T9SS type A sorting domain-containing protein [Melioribacteraceae bacterium]MCF8419180.1 T9SS type A sorting domain-containing protein [Melioribacteraceae bacterium]
MRAGDEWSEYDYPIFSQEIDPGTFEYDILGIRERTDCRLKLSYDTNPLTIKRYSLLGAALYEKKLELISQGYDVSQFIYHPSGLVNYLNSIDGVSFYDSADVFVQNNDEGSYDFGGSHVLPTGNKIVYITFDPLSIQSEPFNYWFGFSESAPHVEALKWFGIDVVTKTKSEDDKIAAEYKLYQNYPNPFNPTTTIKYSIPNTVGDENFRPLLTITMKIYDILGREVRTLVNEKQKPGNYEIEFDGSDFASGVYFYQLRCGEFIDTKKLVLLK